MKIYSDLPKLTTLFLPFIFLTLLACGGLKPTSGGRTSKLYETFYTGAETGTQYFIKPLKFTGEADGGLFVDFTFRDGRFEDDSTTVNYTCVTPVRLGPEVNLLATDASGKELFTTAIPSRLFQERDKDGYRARYTSKIDNAIFVNQIGKQDLRFMIETDGKTYLFIPTPKTKKMLGEIDRQLLSLYRQ